MRDWLQLIECFFMLVSRTDSSQILQTVFLLWIVSKSCAFCCIVLSRLNIANHRFIFHELNRSIASRLNSSSYFIPSSIRDFSATNSLRISSGLFLYWIKSFISPIKCYVIYIKFILSNINIKFYVFGFPDSSPLSLFNNALRMISMSITFCFRNVTKDSLIMSYLKSVEEGKYLSDRSKVESDWEFLF